MRILIVEDVDEMRALIRTALEKSPKFTALSEARTVWEARVEIDRRRPDIVLLDEILPGESSLDFLSDLKSRNIRVYFITSMEHPSKEIPEGVTARLKKPQWDTLEEDSERLIQSLIR